MHTLFWTGLLWMVTSLADAGTVTLTWTASNPPTGVTTYRIYRATAPCTSNVLLQLVRDVGLVTTATDTLPPDPATYCYAVKAYNGTTHLESAFSNKVEFVIPKPSWCAPITNPQQCRVLGGTWRKGHCECP